MPQPFAWPESLPRPRTRNAPSLWLHRRMHGPEAGASNALRPQVASTGTLLGVSVNSRLSIPLLMLLVVLLAGCSGGGSEKPATATSATSVTTGTVPAPTALPTPAPTATPTPAGPRTYSPGTRTGRAEIDPVLTAIEAGTPDALRAIVRYVSPPCVAVRPQGIGPVAVCPVGVSPGTPIDEFPSAPGEGTYIDRKDFEASPRLPGVGMQLLAIARQSQKSTDPGWPQGDYIFYYWGTGGRFEQLFAQDGKAVLACWLCGQPQEDLKRPGIEFILPPLP
jgi:hypothetical protein